MDTPLLALLIGGTCSGKTTVCRYLAEKYKDVLHVEADRWYLDEDRFPRFKQYRNWESIDCIDFQELTRTLLRLREGLDCENFLLMQNRREGRRCWAIFRPAPVIICEGRLLMRYPSLAAAADAVFYLDVPTECLRSRRLARDPALTEYIDKIVLPYNQSLVKPQQNKPGVITLSGLVPMRQIAELMCCAIEDRLGRKLEKK